MRRRFVVYIVLFIESIVLSTSVHGQSNTQKRDSVSIPSKRIATDRKIVGDTVLAKAPKPRDIMVSDLSLPKTTVFKPNPTKAVLYSAIFPGLGQMYNRKYWKLPIVYAGFIGLTYGITWNGRYYNDYSQAYNDMVTGEGTSWQNFLPPGTEITERRIAAFKQKKDFYRRNRDLAIIGMVGLYALCMVDAYVDAQLFDFDISPDLSMHIVPTIDTPTPFTKGSIGLHCSLTF